MSFGRSFIVFFVSIIVLVSIGYSLNITGTVTNRKNYPVIKAYVMLLYNPHFVETDLTGSFWLYDGVQEIQNQLVPFDKSIVIYKGRVTFNLQKKQKVILEAYSVQGKRIACAVNRILPPGKYTVKLLGGNYSHSIFIVHLQVGNRVYNFKVLNGSQYLSLPFQKTGKSITVAKKRSRGAAIDTLKVMKEGYEIYSLPIDSYEGDYKLTLVNNTIQIVATPVKDTVLYIGDSCQYGYDTIRVAGVNPGPCHVTWTSSDSIAIVVNNYGLAKVTAFNQGFSILNVNLINNSDSLLCSDYTYIRLQKHLYDTVFSVKVHSIFGDTLSVGRTGALFADSIRPQDYQHYNCFRKWASSDNSVIKVNTPYSSFDVIKQGTAVLTSTVYYKPND